MDIIQTINNFLEYERVPKHEFDDLKLVVGELGNLKKNKRRRILNWFRVLEKIEIIGWRPRSITKKLVAILSKNNKTNKILFYALFCPSYKKGKGVFGFRTDDIGKTTLSGIKNLIFLWEATKKNGFVCEKPLAIFFDIAIEQPDKVLVADGLRELEINIQNFKKYLPREVCFTKLSELNKELFRHIGYRGLTSNLLHIPNKTFRRIVERGKKFYRLFDWSEQEIIKRSKIIATSEAMVGEYLKYKFPNGIMVYTPTMLERGAVYSGMNFTTDPLPVIFPKKDGDRANEQAGTHF